LLSFLITVALAEPCGPPDLEEAFAALGDGSDLFATLDAVEQTFTCRRFSPTELARFWLLEGAVLLAEADREGAVQSLAAARRVAPDVWQRHLSTDVRAAWERASIPGVGHLDVPSEAELYVDGLLVDPTQPLPTGLHVVQLEQRRRLTFGKVVFVPEGGVHRIQPAELVSEVADDEGIRFEPHVASGLAVAMGRAYTSGELRQASVRVSVPVEVGLTVSFGASGVSFGLGAHRLLGGRYLVVDGDGALADRAVGLEAWVGGHVGTSLRIGGQLGVSSPSRVFGRAEVSVGRTLRAHLRAGLNRVNDGPDVAAALEPALGLLVSVRVP
jgi:hypothetical protein